MTRIRSIVICLFILGFGFLDRVQSDVVVPSDRVSTGVNVRDTPKTSGKILKVLAPGEQLQYVGTVPGWNEVILSDGRSGFVSKSWTRVIPTDETGGTTSGNFTIDVVDVGTGLGIFVRGPDFALVYDGGSNDDFARGSANRFLSFLKSQYPDLTVIDHMILSHPHRDHVELLPDVIAAYQVRNFWDSGAVNDICGYHHLPLFVLHDFDVAGFLILGTLQRDTRRFQFSHAFEVIDLGLRLDDIEGLEREPAAATKISESNLRAQLAENGASEAETDILLDERVELNALTSDDLVAMIERKLEEYGLEKVVPDNAVLAETYRAFHRSYLLREKFKEMEQQFDKEAEAADIPEDLEEEVRAVLAEDTDLRWDDAIQVVLDDTQLSRVREDKEKAKRKSGDFTSDSDDAETAGDA